ncbi:MAG TPA: BON domain-containing protein [Stellaceae bacterium]|nr:BON domain-containing protein [Stellaceae bacterium]
MPEHTRQRSLLGPIAAIGLVTVLPGCVVAAVGAAGTAGGYAMAQERSIGDNISDATLKSVITQSWDKYNTDMTHQLNCNIYEGRVLITGRVPNPEWRDEAVKRAWQVKGVKQVYNEVEIGPDTTTSDDFNDDWISTRLRNELTWDGDIRSLNYTITTTDHVVYLIGSARTQDELNRVTGYARNIPNVRRVVSYVQIRPGAPPESQPTTASPAPVQQMPAADAAPAPVNSAPVSGAAPVSAGDKIEVKPLQ